jgi:eco57I restriction endonuclease|nr:Eco57I restriction-modification methylase domain-containing protein [uncultured Aggregatibacter sp.]
MQNPSINYNPDVLSCLANLSNDEVFTSPALANQMLDLLPQELFRSSTTTFLDPATKSGVFLREIAKRLLEGLKDEIPDLQTRINHILTKQIFGLGITELTALLARRTLYCSREANGKFSVCEGFNNPQGNIFYSPLKHQWENGRCVKCGASEQVYDRGDELENHAYSFIHQDLANINEKLPVKFDVIIGNPPYQLSDGGGTGSAASPIYQFFIQQAIKLDPNYLVMVVPSRWFAGGRGLDEFREEMLLDTRLEEIHDFPNSSDVFTGVDIKGGVNYFLWNKNYSGECLIKTYQKQESVSEMKRFLKEEGLDTFVRYNEAISVLRKVKKFNEKSFSDLISNNDPFGFDRREKNSFKRIKPNYLLKPFPNSIPFYYNGWAKQGLGYIDQFSVSKNKEWIDKYKVLIPKAWGNGDIATDWLKPFIAETSSCCTETYLVIGPLENNQECENVISYIQTRFFHFLVSLIKNTQNSMKKVYELVPMQDFSKPWTDKELYEKYQLTQVEIDYIESMVRPVSNE